LLTGEVISLRDLHEGKHGQILCYPRCEQEEMERRLKELERLKVGAVEFTGEKRVFDLPVLGKGCVGIVVIAYASLGRVALKIRRVDADREEMFHEGEMLKRANVVKVGPQLFDVSKNFLLMEFVEGIHLLPWIESLRGNGVALCVRKVLHNILEQCYRLDEAGLDHGELSNAPKHIIVNADHQPFLVDFETASINRKVANVTSVCQFLFLRSQVAEKVKAKLEEIQKKELIVTLRTYKHKRTRENFEKILEKSLIST
jgi:putative serine/threonine protein kinase